MLASHVADTVNCAPVGKPDGILSSLFLARFAGDNPWIHVDIAGVAWADEDKGIHVAGCAGFGARLLVAFVEGEGARAA
jgi:leucyl aminopeptidase